MLLLHVSVHQDIPHCFFFLFFSIVLGSTLLGHFVLSPREREKRDEIKL